MYRTCRVCTVCAIADNLPNITSSWRKSIWFYGRHVFKPVKNRFVTGLSPDRRRISEVSNLVSTGSHLVDQKNVQGTYENFTNIIEIIIFKFGFGRFYYHFFLITIFKKFPKLYF